MISPLRATRAAFVFLTRVPVGGFPYTSEEWRWAPAYFPFVGATLGATLACLFVVLRPVGSLAAAVLTIAASLLLTGAFHEDGIADTSDALGGAYDRAKLFVILKDSRVGTFGAAALVVSIGGRAALLAQIEANATAVHAAWCLPLVGAVARAAAVWQLAVLPYATAEGAKSGEIARAGVAQAIVATLIAASVVGALVFTHHLTPYRAAALLGVTALVTLVTAQRYMRRAGGVTGDFLGATEQLVELACLATLAWSAA